MNGCWICSWRGRRGRCWSRCLRSSCSWIWRCTFCWAIPRRRWWGTPRCRRRWLSGCSRRTRVPRQLGRCTSWSSSFRARSGQDRVWEFWGRRTRCWSWIWRRRRGPSWKSRRVAGLVCSLEHRKSSRFRLGSWSNRRLSFGCRHRTVPLHRCFRCRRRLNQWHGTLWVCPHRRRSWARLCMKPNSRLLHYRCHRHSLRFLLWFRLRTGWCTSRLWHRIRLLCKWCRKWHWCIASSQQGMRRILQLKGRTRLDKWESSSRRLAEGSCTGRVGTHTVWEPGCKLSSGRMWHIGHWRRIGWLRKLVGRAGRLFGILQCIRICHS